MSESTPPSSPIALVAIGGNALLPDADHATVADQYRAAGTTSHHLAAVLDRGYRLLVTHGNGPQVGYILLRSELAKNVLHTVPLESCVADSQGAIGYQIQQTLDNELNQRGQRLRSASVLTQVLVRADDPAFAAPSKPIGPFYTEAEARLRAAEDDWHVIEDAGRGWRRVVPSPEPVEIIEEDAIRVLLNADFVVIAVGGGGIPVVRLPNGDLVGVPAVIDKDRASCLLARQLDVSLFVLTTSIDFVYADFGRPNARPLHRVTVAEAEAMLAAGEFATGSMRPKVQAAVDFLRHGGERVIITRPESLEDALDGKTGTHFVLD